MQVFDSKVIILFAPTISALGALFIILLDVWNDDPKQRRLKLKLVFYLACSLISTGSMLIYFYNPKLFVWINWLYMFSFMSIPVSFYAFIHDITQTDKPQKFSNYHYVMPVLLALLLIIIELITPADDQMKTITGNGAYCGGSRLFFIFSNGKMFFRFLFSIVYIWLSFRRFPGYRAYIINYTANDTKSSLRWVIVYLFFMICLLPMPLLGIFLPRDVFASSLILAFYFSLMVIQHNFLAYHIVKRNYILEDHIDKSPKEKASEIIDTEFHESIPRQKNTSTIDPDINKAEQVRLKTILFPKNALTREKLEHYMLTKKPYLNSELKITDMLDSLNINRTYFSTFINEEYNMNFSTFINKYRLMEYQLLRSNSDFQGKTNTELAEQAGFGSYRSYRRFVGKIDNNEE